MGFFFCLYNKGVAKASFLSVKGKREKNEDSYGASENFFLVADGLGGHAAGEVASKIAAETAISSFESSKEKDVDKIYDLADKAIARKANANPEYAGMGTTLVSCFLKGKSALIANVGDSRAYLFSKGRLKLVSTDDRGAFGRLTAAMGAGGEDEVHVNEIQIEEGDIILLCSDGLTDFVADNAIKKVLDSDKKLELKAKGLVELALQMGSSDNVTAGLIEK